MTPLQLMQILARAAASLADPAAAPGDTEAMIASIPEEAGLDCEFSVTATGLVVEWRSEPSAEQQTFVAVLSECVNLAGAASARAGYALLDARAFAVELGRVTAAARWRGHVASLAVFEVGGLARGPGVDESDMVAHVGALARSVVRSNDVVGHLGAGRFALLLPRAGTFEARSAYRRVREAVAASEFATDGLGCGQAGFAELGDGSGDEMLAVATKRLTEAVRRTAYTGPGDPMHPLAG